MGLFRGARAIPAAAPEGLRGGRLYFLHIPRTGGVRLRYWLEGMFRPDEVLAPDRWEDLPSDLPPEAVTGVRFVRGHFGALLETVFPAVRSTITLLRDPLERVKSNYSYLREHFPNDPQLRGITSFSDFIHNTRAGRNIQTEHLSITAGPEELPRLRDIHAQAELLDAAWRACPPEQHLELAIERLESMDWFATTEHLEGSVGLLADRLGWPRPASLGTVNTSPRLSDVEVTDADRRFLDDAQAVDRALYEHAAREVRRRLSASSGASTPWRPRVRSRRLTKAVTFDAGEPFWGDGWWGPFPSADGWYRWTGPAPDAWAAFPIRVPVGTRVEAAIAFTSIERNIEELELRINGETLRQRALVRDGANVLWSAVLLARPRASLRWTRLDLRVPEVGPASAKTGGDMSVGVALRWIRFTPPGVRQVQ